MTFNSWTEYVATKKTKHKVLETANQTYRKNILSTYLLTWNERFQRLIWEKDLIKKVKELFDHKVLHTSFLFWWSFAREKSRERLANNHHARITKKRALRCLAIYADGMSTRRRVMQRAAMKHSWRLWTSAVEQTQLREMWPQVETAHTLYRKKLLQHSLRMLKAYVAKRKKKRNLRIKSEILLSLQYLQLWYNKWQEKLYVASLEKQAVAFYQLSCLKYTLSTWEERYLQVVYMAELQENADGYYTHHLVKRCFTVWNTWAASSNQMRTLKAEVHVLYCQRVQKMYFRFWRQVTDERKYRRLKLCNTIKYHRESLMRRVWASWITFHRCKKTETERLRMLRAKLWRAKLRRVLSAWVGYKNEMVRRKKRTEIAVRHHNLALVIRGWDGWLYYVQHRQQKRAACRRYQQPADRLKTVMMGSYLHTWLEMTAQLQRAKRHYLKRLTLRCIRRWTQHYREQTDLKQRKELLRVTSREMVFMRCLKVWRLRLIQQLQVRRQQVVALVFWSSTLQRKCLERWREYARTQQEETKRYMAALETQRASLLEEGLKAWMRADLVAAQQRETSALEYATLRARREFHISSKYFARWKLKVRKKRNKKPLPDVGYQRTIARNTDIQSLLSMVDLQRTHQIALNTPVLQATCNTTRQVPGRQRKHATQARHEHNLDTFHLHRKRPPPRIPLFMKTKPVVTRKQDNAGNEDNADTSK